MERRRGTAAQRGLGASWQRLRGIAVDRHVRQFGWMCPGYGVEAHPSRDLTGDHVLARAHGGVARSLADIRVLCRSCNSRRGAGVPRGDRDMPQTPL